MKYVETKDIINLIKAEIKIGGEKMNYHELTVTMQLKEDITNDQMYSFLNNLINNAMLYNEKLREMHEKNEYKYYTYSSLNPIEKDKTYKKDRIYVFNIRSINKIFLANLKRVLPLTEANAKIISTEIKSYSQKFITEMTTLSPVLATMMEKRYWKKEDGLEEIIVRTCKNAIRKYNQYFNTEVPEDTIFIQAIRQTNIKPVKIPYKHTNLIGNKFVMEIKTDKLSQDLAFFMKATGMLEKNTIGLGYLASK